jgi:hypothetical protein
MNGGFSQKAEKFARYHMVGTVQYVPTSLTALGTVSLEDCPPTSPRISLKTKFSSLMNYCRSLLCTVSRMGSKFSLFSEYRLAYRSRPDTEMYVACWRRRTSCRPRAMTDRSLSSPGSTPETSEHWSSG